MIWIIKRLLRLNYIPKITEFPEYIDEKVYNYIMKISKLKNELYDILQEFQEVKKDLIKDDDFICLRNKLNEICVSDNNCFNFNKKTIFDKQRNYSADNKNKANKEKNINNNDIDKDKSKAKRMNYLENK